MGEKERFEILKNEEIDESIYYYLKNLFMQLNIEILGEHEGNIFDLMRAGLLEGWCWQTTESAALFMPDDVIIYRANLYFNEYKPYYHSYIQFNYKGKNYVFDPCLCLINSSSLYCKIFNVVIKGQVTAKEIKEYFVNYINQSKSKRFFSSNSVSSADRFMRNIFGDDYLEKKEKEVVIYDKENPSAPMYRNGSGYRDINIENSKIRSLTVHYYMNA